MQSARSCWRSRSPPAWPTCGRAASRPKDVCPGVSARGAQRPWRRAQIAVALLGEPLLLDLAAGRIVLWHDANPRRQVPSVLEQLSVGDPGPERTGDHRPDRGDRFQARAQLARLVLLAHYAVERGDLSTDHLDLSYKDNQGCACRHGQPPIALVADDCCELREPEQAALRDDAELAQVPARGVDELRALADQLRARAVHHR